MIQRGSNCPAPIFMRSIILHVFILFLLTKNTCITVKSISISRISLLWWAKKRETHWKKALPFFISRTSSVLVAKSSFPPRSWNPTSLSTAIPFLKANIVTIIIWCKNATLWSSWNKHKAYQHWNLSLTIKICLSGLHPGNYHKLFVTIIIKIKNKRSPESYEFYLNNFQLLLVFSCLLKNQWYSTDMPNTKNDEI